MVLERQAAPFLEWFLGIGEGRITLGALPTLLVVAFVLGVGALVVSFLVCFVRYGPVKAGDIVYRVTSTGARELFQLSPRRIWALAKLAVQESIRRRIWVAAVVYLVILLFATWFIPKSYRDLSELYFTFVLSATTLLILATVLLLSTFSLPADIKNKTIYTVVTKPVRAGEIVLGRMLGFAIVGTVLLVLMAICSYVFVIRSLDHEHQVETASLRKQDNDDGSSGGSQGRSTLDADHRHGVYTNAEGKWGVEPNYGHTHRVYESGGVTLLGEPLGYVQARVPYYGKLRFRDRSGNDAAEGINVGNEWQYRSFIEGRSPAAAIWTFDDARAVLDDDKLNLELIVRVFRTHKGVIAQGIRGLIYLRNPVDDVRTADRIFTARDASIDRFTFNRELEDTNGNKIDLLDDLVSEDGRIEVWVKCLDPGQYFGFAQADCYVRLPDADPVLNFCKAQVSIWVQMLIVIAVGVACSTLVNAPVAMLFTVSFVLLGFFRDSFLKIATAQNYGGGPVESLVRIFKQMNMISPLDEGVGTTLVKSIDFVVTKLMWTVAQVLPDFGRFNTIRYVAEGFNIPANQVVQDVLIGLSFTAVLFVVGYFFLRTREVAK